MLIPSTQANTGVVQGEWIELPNPSNGVRAVYGANAVTRNPSPGAHPAFGLMTPASSTHSKIGSWRSGTNAFWTPTTATVSGLVQAGGHPPPSMDGRHSSDLTSRLGDAVEYIDAAAQVEDAHEQDQEDDQRERELDQGLPLSVEPDVRHHQLRTMSKNTLGLAPPRFEATSVTLRVLFLLVLE